MNRLRKLKDIFQLAISVGLSAVNVWLASEPITQTIGVVYKFGDMFYNPSLGIISQDATHKHLCTMKVASPFTDYMYNVTDSYHRIDKRYVCRWSPESLFDDSLCFEKFECHPLKMIYDVNIACSSLFLLGFFLVAILWLYRPSNRRNRIILWCVGTAVLISSFMVSKISSSYLREIELQDILEKIKAIVLKQGSMDISYDTTVSRFDMNSSISQTIFDICSGMALGLIANATRFLYRPKRKEEHSSYMELQRRFLV